MNPITRYLACRRLARTMRPDPEYRTHRLAQFSPERQARYWKNVTFDEGD